MSLISAHLLTLSSTSNLSIFIFFSKESLHYSFLQLHYSFSSATKRNDGKEEKKIGIDKDEETSVEGQLVKSFK